MNRIFNLTKIQRDFVLSEAPIAAFVGPLGTGKTISSAIKILHRASEANKIGCFFNAVMIRDSTANLTRHTIPSLTKLFGDFTEFKRIEKLGGLVWRGENFNCILLGVDSMKGLGRLHGLEPDHVHIEEPCPISSAMNAGVSEDVFLMSKARLSRGNPRIKKQLSISTNPPDSLHWVNARVLDPQEDADLGMAEVFRGRKEDDIWSTDDDKRKRAQAYAHRPDLYARYIDGKVGAVLQGVAVTPDYTADMYSKHDILPAKDIPTAIMSWDGGHNGVALVAQQLRDGRLMILDCFHKPGIGIRQLCNVFVKPALAQRYSSITDWKMIGDETMATAAEADILLSGAIVISEELGFSFQPIDNAWHNRDEAMRNLFSHRINGLPSILVSNHCKAVDEALSGGWAYQRYPSGVVADRPTKSHPASDIGDTISYLACYLGQNPIKRAYANTGAAIKLAMNRARSYV